MMKLGTKLAILAIGLTTATPVWAEGQHYVGVGLGALNIGNGISKKAVFGGYIQLGHDFSEHLGAEVRIGATGSTSGATPGAAKERMEFVAHYLKPQYAFTDTLTGYALAGFAVAHCSYQPAGGVKKTKNRISYAYGLGLDYRVSDDYSAGIEWSHMMSKPKNSAATMATDFKGLEASVFTTAIRYRF
ncbi:porin family protein [Mariprofundus erugo]|uniref:Porin family protein n=2 Tax=Mariprofundus erugo TaxID=2528639 RepID=A0A5R9GH42_9PROT|nr:porin family protein [Mariprofundus erugo]